MNEYKITLALYEISMSIGTNLDLKNMLDKTANIMLSRLECSSFCIHKKVNNEYELKYAKPKVVKKNSAFIKNVKLLEKEFKNNNERVVYKEFNNTHYYLFELKNYGYLLLTKSALPLDETLVNALKKINLKLVNAIFASLDHTKLKESEERLNNAQKIAHLGNWSWNIKTDEIEWSDEIFRIFAEEPNSFKPTYKKFLSYIPKEEQDIVHYAVNKSLADKDYIYNITHKIIKKGGSTAYVSERGEVIFDEDNKPIIMQGTVLDITNIYTAEKKLQEQKEVLYHQAHHDDLTLLPNRLLFKDRLSHAISKTKRSKIEFALFFIDLDNFKHINDSLGHDIGDKVLQRSATRVKNLIREEDTLARIGGDEFTIIIENLIKSEYASKLATKIIDVINKPMIIDNHNISISCSIGISIYPKDASNQKDLLKHADIAMYEAKADGRNRFKYYRFNMDNAPL